MKVVIGSCCYWLSFSASTCIRIGYDRVVPKTLKLCMQRRRGEGEIQNICQSTVLHIVSRLYNISCGASHRRV